MLNPREAFTSAMLLLCICSVRMLQATPVAGDGESPRSSRDARSFFPFVMRAPDHVHYYPEQHHHHHFADYANSGFPGHHDAHYHLDSVFDHQHHHHHDFHEGHFDQHYY
uniref:Uncharacterized protein n=1 Tax=Anopheles atroparvus TaxID=41427 RepID=A0AAG5D941_ANOAO